MWNMKEFSEGKCIAVFRTRIEMETFLARCKKYDMGFGRERNAELPDEVATDNDAATRGIICDGHNRLYFNRLIKPEHRLLYGDVLYGENIKEV